MLVFGTGGLSDILTPEQEEELKELLAVKMKQMLEENGGWFSSFGTDPILLLIELEDKFNDGETE